MNVIQVRVDDNLHTRVKIACAKRKESMCQVGVKLFKEWLERIEKDTTLREASQEKDT